jgi:uncharacterized damage-inducible protein DinB
MVGAANRRPGDDRAGGGDGLLRRDGVERRTDLRLEALASPLSRPPPAAGQLLLRRYAPGKWTIKEILVHVVDDERIYAYRALRFARGDLTPLPGFEQDEFAAASDANERPVPDILAEHAAVRDATIALFRGLPEAALLRSGVADGKRFTVRALGYHMAGHEAHHMAVVKERYLGGGQP